VEVGLVFVASKEGVSIAMSFGNLWEGLIYFWFTTVIILIGYGVDRSVISRAV
jgi:hypothetical protein